MRAFLLLLLAVATGAPAAAAGDVGRTLQALERDIGAATAHAAALRERFAGAVATDEGADIAGIADGGVGSSFTALRLAARAVDRRLERLRLATAGALTPEQAEVMLVLRASLANLHWTIESIPATLEPDAETTVRRERQLTRLDEALGELDLATAAMASFDWAER